MAFTYTHHLCLPPRIPPPSITRRECSEERKEGVHNRGGHNPVTPLSSVSGYGGMNRPFYTKGDNSNDNETMTLDLCTETTTKTQSPSTCPEVLLCTPINIPVGRGTFRRPEPTTRNRSGEWARIRDGGPWSGRRKNTSLEKTFHRSGVGSHRWVESVGTVRSPTLGPTQTRWTRELDGETTGRSKYRGTGSSLLVSRPGTQY